MWGHCARDCRVSVMYGHPWTFSQIPRRRVGAWPANEDGGHVAVAAGIRDDGERGDGECRGGQRWRGGQGHSWQCFMWHVHHHSVAHMHPQGHLHMSYAHTHAAPMCPAPHSPSLCIPCASRVQTAHGPPLCVSTHANVPYSPPLVPHL